MARLSAYAMKNDTFRQVVHTKNYSSNFTNIEPFQIVNDENLDPNKVTI